MATFYKSTLPILLITLSMMCISSAASSTNKFLESSCKPTSYPNICMKTLSAYSTVVHRSLRHLADVALALSARRAHETLTYASQISSKNRKHDSVQNVVNYAFQDCMVTMADSAERLSRSIRQLRKLGRANRPSFKVRLNNVLTWMSAALTDQSMCVVSLTESGITGSDAHVILRRKVVEASKITSNALSLVNRLRAGN